MPSVPEGQVLVLSNDAQGLDAGNIVWTMQPLHEAVTRLRAHPAP